MKKGVGHKLYLKNILTKFLKLGNVIKRFYKYMRPLTLYTQTHQYVYSPYCSVNIFYDTDKENLFNNH